MISLAFAIGCVLVVGLACRRLPVLRGWFPGFGLLIATCTVVPPHQIIAFGVGLDDALFVVGVLLLVPSAYASRAQLAALPYARWFGIGGGLLIAGMTVSTFVNAETVPDTVSLLLRGPGRILLYVVGLLVVFVQLPWERTRAVVARGLVGVGVLEAVVGLVAYVVPLPGGFGLEAAHGNTSLLGEIPGRISGTLELSPNFLGALFTLTIPVTVGLGLDTAPGPRRGLRYAGWTAAVLAQLAALVLTYTRVSLAVTVLACAALVVLSKVASKGRLLWLVGGAAALGVLLLSTPAFSRFLTDSSDRMALYASGLRVFADHLLAGVGPGMQAGFTAADPERYRATSYGVAGNNAHNTVLLAGAENGVLGLVGALVLNLAFVLVAIGLIRRARRSQVRLAEPLAIAVAVLAFLLQGMTNNLFTVTLTASALVMLVGGCALPWLVGTWPVSTTDESTEATRASEV